MSGWNKCTCKGSWEDKRVNWVVVHRNHNHSYFEAPKGAEHWSDYSAVSCTKCTGYFRVNAKYVRCLPNGELQ